jgi:hypothetical protein
LAASVQLNRYASGTGTWEEIMELGNFSVSLAVKDIQASKVFYEKLGFTAFAGDQSQNWLIMKNGDQNIGLFQGMFDKNILTFNRDGRAMPNHSKNSQTSESCSVSSRLVASR